MMENSKPLQLLREHWRTTLVCLVLGLLGALLVTVLMPKTYTSTATIYVSAVPGSDASALLESGQLSEQRMKSYVQLATSDRVGREVVADLGLSATAEQLLQHVSATSPAGTVVLNISASDTSPDRAAQIANSVAAAFDRLVAELERPGNPTGPRIITTQVVEPALPPAEPEWPSPLLNVALGAVVGLLIGVGAAVVRGRLDNSVKSADDLRRIAPLRVLGRIPQDRRLNRQPLAVHARPLSPAAEAFRQLRTSLQFLHSTQRVNVIMVTSPLRGEGRTTTICNLAVAMAQVGRRVVVVDADLRQPKVADMLQLSGGLGLSEMLAGSTKLPNVVRSWGGGVFDVVTSGRVPTNPSELLDSPRMANLIRDLRTRYDIVLVDAPPLLPVTDAAALTKLMDGSLLLARHGVTTVEQVHAALGSLATVSARVLGTVLTATPGAESQATERGEERWRSPQQGGWFRDPPLDGEGEGAFGGPSNGTVTLPHDERNPADPNALNSDPGSGQGLPSPRPRSMDVATVMIPRLPLENAGDPNVGAKAGEVKTAAGTTTATDDEADDPKQSKK